jgi:hypothetical protein
MARYVKAEDIVPDGQWVYDHELGRRLAFLCPSCGEPRALREIDILANCVPACPRCLVVQAELERRYSRVFIAYPPFSPVISPICYDKGEML